MDSLVHQTSQTDLPADAGAWEKASPTTHPEIPMWSPFRRWRETRALVDGEAERMIAEMGALPAILAAHTCYADTSRPLSERRLYHHVTLRIAQKADIPLRWG